MEKSEQEYLTTLKDRLSGHVSREDLDDILSDYAEHFSIGRAEGRSEEDLCRSLGSPGDVAREIRATYLVEKAEQARSAENIWHAVIATLGLGLFNLVFVLLPFLLLVVLLIIVFMAGLVMLVAGPILFLVAVMQLAGVSPVAVPWWSSPILGIFISLGLAIAGVIVVILAIHLARFFYRLAIRYMKWNIHVIRGGDARKDDEHADRTVVIPRDDATALTLQMRFGAGEIAMGEEIESGTLVRLMNDGGPTPLPLDWSVTRSGMRKIVRFRGGHPFSSPWWSEEPARSWDLHVNREIPVALDLWNKAGRIRLSLGNLDLSSLRIKNGAGETCIDLAGYRGGSFDAEIKNGVGSLVIRVPKECNLQVRIYRGIGDANVRGLIAEGDTYVSPVDQPGAPRISCQIKQGVGSISLEAV